MTSVMLLRIQSSPSISRGKDDIVLDAASRSVGSLKLGFAGAVMPVAHDHTRNVGNLASKRHFKGGNCLLL